jgi:hypothetical protein
MPGKTDNGFKYTVDGEKVTFEEIVTRCHLVNRSVLNNRVRLGWRAWAELQKPSGPQVKRKGKPFTVSLSQTRKKSTT